MIGIYLQISLVFYQPILCARFIEPFFLILKLLTKHPIEWVEVAQRWRVCLSEPVGRHSDLAACCAQLKSRFTNGSNMLQATNRCNRAGAFFRAPSTGWAPGHIRRPSNMEGIQVFTSGRRRPWSLCTKGPSYACYKEVRATRQSLAPFGRAFRFT